MGSANPATLAFDCGANATVLVVAVTSNTTTARAGGLPSYGGTPMSDSGQGSVSQGGGETSCELFYLIDPASGSNSISVPNTNADSIGIAAVSFEGGTSAFDTSVSATGDDTTPTDDITTGDDGCAIVAVMTSGARDEPSATAPSTLLYTDDWGNQVMGFSYYEQAGQGQQTMAFSTPQSETWEIIVISIKN